MVTRKENIRPIIKEQMRAGDCTYTPSGEGHSIANAGTQPLEFMALIVKA